MVVLVKTEALLGKIVMEVPAGEAAARAGVTVQAPSVTKTNTRSGPRFLCKKCM